jgi:MFS family permease
LAPQLFVGYLAQRASSSLKYFVIGGYGRATCLLLLAGLLASAAHSATPWVVARFFVCWTAYAFVSGIIAVPYNDIVARSVGSKRRSRLLAIRFFGGGMLGLGAAAWQTNW